MTGAGEARLRARAALVVLAGGVLALLVPVLLGGPGGTLDLTAALVVGALAATLAGWHHHPVAAGHPPRPALLRWTGDDAPAASSRIPDPVHHPVSPRAPGQV